MGWRLEWLTCHTELVLLFVPGMHYGTNQCNRDEISLHARILDRKRVVSPLACVVPTRSLSHTRLSSLTPFSRMCDCSISTTVGLCRCR
eukprot:7082490-Prymnesium_polylepis.2